MGLDKQKLYDRSIYALVHFLRTNFIIIMFTWNCLYIFSAYSQNPLLKGNENAFHI